jgi:branched-chain amino acid transport system ATP-binding protein
MTAPLLAVEGLTVGYGGGIAVQGIDLTVGEGQVVALLGGNGAGKSTLLKAIIGLLRPSIGRIAFAGRPIDHLRTDRRTRLGIGYCPEGRRVFPGLSVWENLAVACWDGPRLRAERMAEVFAMFPALAEHRSRPAWELSGGGQQMLAIGRALMNGPRLVLLDEPSLGLSPRLVAAVFERIRAIAAAGTAVLLAEQNAASALQVCERAYVLQVGRVVRAGSAAQIAGSRDIQAAFLGD